MSTTIRRIADLSFALHRTMRQRAFAPLKHLRGIGIAHLHALGLLAERQSVTMTDLARHLQISPSSATSFVMRLEKRGFVKRTREKENRKLVKIVLTPKGKTLLKKLEEGQRKIVADMFSGLPENVQKTFEQSLSQVVAHLSKI